MDNLDTYVKALDSGLKVKKIKFGFVHVEPHGVLAIDQRGGGKNLAEARLYVFPDERTEKLYLLTLGDKKSQSRDIQFTTEFVVDLRENGK